MVRNKNATSFNYESEIFELVKVPIEHRIKKFIGRTLAEQGACCFKRKGNV